MVYGNQQSGQNAYNFDPSNPVYNQQFGGFNNFINQFNTFQQMFNQSAQMSPEQIIKQKIQSGAISQQQFAATAQMANFLMGVK